MSIADKTFVSYSRADKAFVQRLAAELREAGVDLWIDIFDIPKGARWDDAVEEALKNCHTLLVVLSPDSVASQNVKDEFGDAMQRGKTIVPVLYKPCEIPMRMRRIEMVDLSSDYNEGLAKLRVWLSQQSGPAAGAKAERPRAAEPQRATAPPNPRASRSKLIATAVIAAVFAAVVVVFGLNRPSSNERAVEAATPQAHPTPSVSSSTEDASPRPTVETMLRDKNYLLSGQLASEAEAEQLMGRLAEQKIKSEKINDPDASTPTWYVRAGPIARSAQSETLDRLAGLSLGSTFQQQPD